MRFLGHALPVHGRGEPEPPQSGRRGHPGGERRHRRGAERPAHGRDAQLRALKEGPMAKCRFRRNWYRFWMRPGCVASGCVQDASGFRNSGKNYVNISHHFLFFVFVCYLIISNMLHLIFQFSSDLLHKIESSANSQFWQKFRQNRI